MRGNGNDSASTSSENNKQRALQYGGSGALTGWSQCRAEPCQLCAGGATE